MDFKLYGVATYSDDIELLRDYYSDMLIEVGLDSNDDMIVNVMDCDSLEDAKNVLLLASERWLNNLISDKVGVDFNKIISLSDKGVLNGLDLGNGCYLKDFRLTDRECKMSLKLDTDYSIRYEIIEATYCFNNK